MLLRPLPYANALCLVLVWGDMRNRNVTDFPFPSGDYLDLKSLQGGAPADVVARAYVHCITGTESGKVIAAS